MIDILFGVQKAAAAKRKKEKASADEDEKEDDDDEEEKSKQKKGKAAAKKVDDGAKAKTPTVPSVPDRRVERVRFYIFDIV